MATKVKFSLILSIMIIIVMITITIFNAGVTIYNPTGSMTATITNEVEAYGTDYVYVSNMPKTAEPIVISEGINGLDYTYDGLNYVHLSDKKNEVVQVGTGKDGNVACRTKTGTNHSLINDGLYYSDDIYGSVRILAADNSAFPCGTIVKVNNGTLKEFFGIVLDSGSAMRKAWKEGIVWMDLAFTTQKEARTGGATSSNTKFEVQRWGW